MNNKDYEARIQELEAQVKVLQEANVNLINRNMQLGQMVDAYYDVRRRIEMLKDLVIRHKELLKEADLRDDDELMAVIETHLEESLSYTNPDFGLKELADLVGTTQTRIVELFRRSTLHKSLDDYLDYLRILRSMFLLQTQPSWSIAACAQEAGFTVIRSFNRKFQDAIGMTPHEFRLLCENNKID
jgi:transcriptional regulator GlxA family with amidase domain